VASLAARHGFSAQITPTTTPIGRFWASDQTAVSLNQFHSIRTEWDLIVTLGRLEGFDAFFQGGTFYFQPQADPDTATPYVWQYAFDTTGRPVSNVVGLRMTRESIVAKGVQVVVKSWNAKQGALIVKYAPASPVADGPPQEYYINKPNLTDDQAQALANARFIEISKREMAISGTLLGDLILTPQCVVQLTGTGTAFDQPYYPQSVTRNLSVNGGFTMQAVCCNHNTYNPQQVAAVKAAKPHKPPHKAASKNKSAGPVIT
jgi:hypothetical protein